MALLVPCSLLCSRNFRSSESSMQEEEKEEDNREHFFLKKRTVGMKAPIPNMTNDQRDYSYLLTARSYFSLSHFTCLYIIQHTFHASGTHNCIKSKTYG